VLSKSRGRSAILLAATLATVLSGCSLVKKKRPTLTYQERPVELLYSVGADRLDHHQWAEAVNYFREVERQHPYSEWSRRSILMTAYAHYQANEYPDAIADAERFISLYPGNSSTPYAYYLKAVCYFEQIVDVGRDQAAAGQAQLALLEVIKRYPNTEYAVDARLKLDMVVDQLAGKEMNIGRYYVRAGDDIAALGRFRVVVDRYQTTSHTPEALYRLTSIYLALGLLPEAEKNAAVLGFNYPGSYWYREAYNLMTSRGLRLAQAPKDYRGTGLENVLPFNRHAGAPLAPPAFDPATGKVTASPMASTPVAPAKGATHKTEPVHDLLGL
jgi:outer membrane protein assembly factor BamD